MWKYLAVTRALIFSSEGFIVKAPVPYSRHFIFFVIYELAQKVRVFIISRTFSEVYCNTLSFRAYS